MSLTKESEGYERHMEEVRKMDDMSYEYYAEELYLNRLKARMPVDDEQPEHKPAERHNP
jgi:hypothetical protein